jgi:hypothetical protein
MALASKNVMIQTIRAHLLHSALSVRILHQGREIIAIVPLENGAFCTIFSENFHKF